MQDRRLSRDDNRGLVQGVLDNIRTRHTFKVIIEKARKPCVVSVFSYSSFAWYLNTKERMIDQLINFCTSSRKTR